MGFYGSGRLGLFGVSEEISFFLMRLGFIIFLGFFDYIAGGLRVDRRTLY